MLLIVITALALLSYSLWPKQTEEAIEVAEVVEEILE